MCITKYKSIKYKVYELIMDFTHRSWAHPGKIYKTINLSVFCGVLERTVHVCIQSFWYSPFVLWYEEHNSTNAGITFHLSAFGAYTHTHTHFFLCENSVKINVIMFKLNISCEMAKVFFVVVAVGRPKPVSWKRPISISKERTYSLFSLFLIFCCFGSVFFSRRKMH